MNIIAFTSMPREKIQLYRSIQEYLRTKNGRIFIVVFDHWDITPADLCFIDHVWACSSDITKTRVPMIPIQYSNGVPARFASILSQQKEVYGLQNYSASNLLKKIERIYHYLYSLIESHRPSLVIRNFLARPMHSLVRLVARQTNTPSIDYQAWAYPRTYQFGRQLWRPSPGFRTSEGFASPIYHRISKDLMRRGEQKRNVYREEFFSRHQTYLLFLSGGFGSGATIRSSEEYKSIGSGWGKDFQRVNALERSLDKIWPECILLVRQHPYARPALTGDEFTRRSTRLVNQKSLNDLLSNAAGVVCGQTSLVYHALHREKPVCVLGRHELDGQSFLTRCDNLEDLQNWLVSLRDGELNLDFSREDVERVCGRFIANCVVALDYPDTLHCLDPYLQASIN